VIAEAGHVRSCPACGAVHHPRTDPVVIAVVVGGDAILLGRRAGWPAGRHSALAGFVEPGESVEEAVVRELWEEAGVEVADVRYRLSQPWPFPASLMLGFTARHVSGDAHPRDRELEAVSWFTRAHVEAAAAGKGRLVLPPPETIARVLVDDWLATPA
jgi:NAD+ diphosphatase